MSKKNDYIERIALSRLLFVVTSKLYKDGFIKQELDANLSAFNDYVNSEDFDALCDDEKSKATLLMLYDTLETALPYLQRACAPESIGKPPKEVDITKDKALELLEKLYNEDNNEEFINMNINEWIEKSGFKVVEQSDDNSESDK